MKTTSPGWFAALLPLLLAGAAGADGGASCDVSADPIVFGSYSPIDLAGLDSTGRVTVHCGRLAAGTPTSVAYVIRLGAGSSGSVGRRAMSGARGSLIYGLYTNATRTTIWGDGTEGSATVSDAWDVPASGLSREYVVYGLLPARQNVRPGVYTDLVVVTVEY